ncbi:MAG: tRNA uridine-5-carboxymethylaminomethyl(34) synthesis enzyme MnmG [Muribaculaceae bacterium]|nr:tRNA uridine-5-carboxymethylaminomethyl(34) synthesis enzyme MnmG [Muribaculaceae bacterium]
MKFDYDVIVVGAGHAGCEAAVAAARLGVSVLLITADLNKVAQMSCNPAVGGIAKGQIVREIDALGGQMGIIADTTAIQFRMLNRSKGPAVWSPRVQSDRSRYIDAWRKVLESEPGLELFQDMVTGFEFEKVNGAIRVIAVNTALGFRFGAKKVVLTAGTFLNGLMHFGATQIEGGRVSEPAAKGITEQLMEIGFHSLRMKTGTPARIDSRSIDFSLAERQDGDDVVEVTAKGEDGMEDSVALVRRDFHKFSFLPGVQRILKPRSCYIVHTNPEVHKVLSDNLADSPLYNGQIRSIGPRYCPSIETKIVTFSDKESHQLFLEPEGESTTEFYINGFSSSLPWRVQLDSLRHVPALRDVHFYRPGYAIEYDYFDPTQLTHDLQTKLVEGLYFAGQVNGTTGYEEAAAQGLMAGINAALSVAGKSPLVLGRDQAYIGVLIDDLVTKGVDEPYRMFTSRAEYRILLRQDDADMRLTPVGAEVGLATPERVAAMTAKREMRDSLIEWCAGFTVKMGDKINGWLSGMGTSPLSSSMRLYELLKRPQLNFSNLSTVISRLRKRLEELPEERREEIVESAEILIKYGGYIDRERELAEKYRRLEYVRIPEEIDYCSLHSLSTEARQKLQAIRPATIGQASRIPGVSPADINILLVLLHR